MQKKTEEEKIDDSPIRVKKAWEIALGPGKSIPMNAFMMWMSGNTVQIFR